MKYLSIDLSPEERAAYNAAEKKWRARALTALLVGQVALAFYLDSLIYWTELMLMAAFAVSIPVLLAIVEITNRAGEYAGDRAVDQMRARFDSAAVRELCEFIAQSKRGICAFRGAAGEEAAG